MNHNQKLFNDTLKPSSVPAELRKVSSSYETFSPKMFRDNALGHTELMVTINTIKNKMLAVMESFPTIVDLFKPQSEKNGYY